MPQEVFRQANFTNGELDPAMLGRRDLKAYFASLAKAENLLQTPQGPIGRRPGLAFVDLIRNPLEAVVIPAMAITAPNGGTADDARTAADASPLTTTAMEVVDPYVILLIDFGAAVEISVVDVIDIAVVAAGDDGSGYTPPPIIIDPYPGGFEGGFFGGGFIP